MDLTPLKIDRNKAAPRARPGSLAPKLFGLGALAAVAAVAWVFWPAIKGRVDAIRLPTVKVVRVEESHPAAAGAVRGMASNGYIVASRRAALSADTPGRIVEMHVTEGSLVQEGDLVARLFSEEYAASVARADADIARAEASKKSAEASRDAARTEVGRLAAAVVAAEEAIAADQSDVGLAERELGREEGLERDGVGRDRDLDRARAALERGRASLRRSRALKNAATEAVAAAESQVEVAEARIVEAGAAIAVARAARQLAQATLKKTEVRAPFTGIVVLKDAEVGEVVSPNSGSTRGSVVTMVDLASLEVQADVPETSLKAVRVGGPARIFLDAWPGEPYRGRVDRIWPTANRQKATVEVRVSFVDRDERLRPEMGVRIVFTPDDEPPANGASPDGGTPAAAGAEASPIILVPETAVVRLDGKSGVFLLERDAVRFHPVQVGKTTGGRVAIESGLAGGERIIAAPSSTLSDGDRVRVENESS